MMGLAPGFEGTDRYQLRRLIGRGGMAVVYEAFDRRYATEIALKLLPVANAELLLRFKREFRNAAEVDHPNLVRLGELVAHADHWFFTMELIRGVDFVSHVKGGRLRRSSRARVLGQSEAELVGEQSTLLASEPAGPDAGSPTSDERRMRDALLQLVQGLGALHGAGCVHRDVKPSNVLVEDAGRVVLLDFGLASLAKAETTLFGAGTPSYMAPEQATPGPVQSSADWYGVGVILFELLTGRLPFVGPPHQVVAAKQGGPAPKVRSLAPAAPADLAELCDGLLARDARERPAQGHILETLRAREGAESGKRERVLPRRSEDLLGRDPELQLLGSALEDVKVNGSARAVILFGESGMGKSSLGKAFCETVSASGQSLVLSARCHERELVPYKAVDGIVDALARWLSRLDAGELATLLPARAGVLAQSFPVLARLELLRDFREPDLALDRREVRSWLFAAFRELFRALGARTPVLMFIDDLHFSDRDSIALLTETLRPPDAPRLLVLGTVRSSASDFEPETLFSPDIHQEHVLLHALPVVSAQALARSLLGVGIEPATVDLVARESAGHPLFLHELARSVLSETLGQGPVTLEGVLRARTSELPEPARRVLETLALAGAPIEIPILGEAASVTGHELLRAVEALKAARLVQAVHGMQDDRLELTHDRVRAAVVLELGEADARASHGRLALALERSGQRVASATHWRAARETERAAEHYRAAAELSADALAFDDAAEQYQVALELGSWSSEQGHELRLALADALSNAGKGALAAPHYLAAAVGAPLAQRPRLNRRAAEELIRSGRLDEGLVIARAVLEQAGMRLPRFPLLALLTRRLLLTLRGLRHERRSSLTPDAQELERIDLCWSLSSGLVLTDHILGAYFQSLGLWRALDSGDLYRVARGLAAEAAFTAGHARQNQQRVAALLDQADRLARRIEDARAAGTVLMMGGISDHLVGDFARARVRLEAATSTFREGCTGMIWELDACRQFWLECLFYQGEVRLLIDAVHAGLREARMRGSLYAATNLQTGLSNVVWLLEDNASEARERASEAMARWSARGFHVQHWYDLVAQTHIDLYQGKGVSAHERVEAAWSALRRSHLLRITHTRIVAVHLRARAALAAAAELSPVSRVRCVRLARAGCRALARERDPWGQAMGSLIRAGLLSLQHDGATREILRATIDELAGVNLGFYGMLCDALAREDGAPWLISCGIRNPSALARMLLPGLYLGQFT